MIKESSGMLQRVDIVRPASPRCKVELLVAAKVPTSLILFNLMIKAIRSSGTPALTRATRCNIPEDGILHSHRRENLKSYIALTGWGL
jgi:hypothetical protein